MTKAVRIENADLSSFKVKVLTYDQKVSGVCDPLNDTLVSTQDLDHPTMMTSAGSTYLTSTRYMVVKEA